jgi:hypothetical protein
MFSELGFAQAAAANATATSNLEGLGTLRGCPESVTLTDGEWTRGTDLSIPVGC